MKENLNNTERRLAKWIVDGHHITCNNCKVTMCRLDREEDEIPRKFCPQCGFKMEEELFYESE